MRPFIELYIDNEMITSYQNLVDALQRAIDKEAAEHNGKFVTNERVTAPIAKTYDYDALREEFDAIVSSLMNKDPNYYAPRVTQIVEKYLGKGKKVSETSREQAEFISLIVGEMKDDLVK